MPVPTRDEEELAQRALFFMEILDLQCSSKAYADVPLVYHKSMPNLLAHVHFALTDAFKKEFLKDGHRTDLNKRAAITCATIAYVGPLRPTPGSNIAHSEETLESAHYLYANPMAAMRAACSIVPHPFHKRPFDDQHRIFRALRGIELPSVDWIIDESKANNGEIKSDCVVKLSEAEIATLCLLVDDFVVYSYLQNPEQWVYR
jgi:hypothetical protein